VDSKKTIIEEMKEAVILVMNAVLAKEKKFNEECRHFYKGEELRTFTNNWEFNNKLLVENQYSAPSQSFLRDWLRKNFKIDIEIIHHLDEKTDEVVAYGFAVFYKAQIFKTDDEYSKYKDALEPALHYSLNLIEE